MEDPLDAPAEFWKYLVDAGILDPELAEEFHSRTDRAWVPLGRILVSGGVLDHDQVTGLLAIQGDEPHLRLGDLAVREGMCTQDQVAEALREQRALSPHPIELLLRDTRVDKRGLLGPLIDYVQWLEGRLHACAEVGE